MEGVCRNAGVISTDRLPLQVTTIQKGAISSPHVSIRVVLFLLRIYLLRL
jgi:hypothetical protein